MVRFAFLAEVVKSVNPEAYIVGEIWTSDIRWVGESHFDGLMNYPIVESLTGLMISNTLDVKHFSERIEGLLSYYPLKNAYAMYVPLSSHDTERILTRMENNIAKTKFSYLFQLSYPGAPAIYYGDEIGLTGGKDPGCRGAFIWDEGQWNNELRNFIKNLVQLRKKHPALRSGEFISWANCSNQEFYVFLRKDANEQILVILNASDQSQNATICMDAIGWENGSMLTDLLLPWKRYLILNNTLEISLPAWSGLWLA